MRSPSGPAWLPRTGITTMRISSPCYSRLPPRWTRFRSEKALDRLRVPSTGTDKKGRILPDSLEKTLLVHRAANRASLLRKVAYNKPSPDVFRPILSKKSLEAKQQDTVNQEKQDLSSAERSSDKQTSAARDSKKESSLQNDAGVSSQKLESTTDGSSRDTGQGTG